MSYMFSGCWNLSSIVLGSNFKFLSNTWIDSYLSDKNGFTKKWTYQTAYNHTDAVSSLADSYDGSKPGLWTWEKEGVDPASQNYTSVSDNFYTPEYNADGTLKETPNAKFQKDGYWQKIDDNTFSYTFYVLNSNTRWYVWEENIEGYVSNGESTSGKAGKATQNEPIIIENGSDIVTITNTETSKSELTYGSLKITKTVSGEMPNDVNNFSFTITLKDSNENSLNGTEIIGGVAFKDGVGKISVKANSSITIENIPSGYSYIVSEDETDYKVETSYQNATGKISANTVSEVTVNNKFSKIHNTSEKTGSFEIVNIVEDSSDTNEEISYVITLSNLEPGYSYKANNETNGIEFVADKDGNATIEIELKNNEKLSFKELPEGSSYIITSKANQGVSSFSATTNKTIINSYGSNSEAYKELSTNFENVETDETAIFTFKHIITKTKNLILTKEVLNPNGEVADTAIFEFTIKLSNLKQGQIIDTDSIGRFKADQDGEAEKTIELINGESVSLYNLPIGTKYSITESKVANYSQSAKINDNVISLTANSDDSNTYSGVVENGNNDTIEIVWTNTYIQQYTIAVSNTVNGNMGVFNKDFIFTMQFSSNRANTTIVATTQKGKQALVKIDDTGLATFTLKNGETLSFEGLTTDDMRFAFDGSSSDQITKEKVEATNMKVKENDYTEDGYKTTSITSYNETSYTATISVTNTKDIAIQTGINTQIIVGLGFCAILVVIGIIYIILKKKGKNER